MSVDYWYKHAIFYEVYIRAFKDSNGDGHGDIQGLIQGLDYLKDLGVDCIWIMPMYPSPLKDDGYDISDFYHVHPDYGTVADFKQLLEAAHARGIRVITDLVLNHISDQHPWFQSAIQSRTSPYRDYFVWSDSDQLYQDARIIFIDTEKSNWTFEPNTGQYYWHRFYTSQPDLNYDNPAVRKEMIDILRYWLEIGIDGFRVDAVPYLFEREGTSCENLPETHQFLQSIRKIIDEEYPGRILLCEANQWPKDVVHYFGDGDECHMAFQFPVMPRIFKGLMNGDSGSLHWALQQTGKIPDNCQWCTFLRNHDELTLEMVKPEERTEMWQFYAPQKRMRSNLGIRRRLASLLDNDRRKIELAYSILFTIPGTPILYYGDEIGMGDNIYLHDRNGVRTPMQWNAEPQAGFSKSNRIFSPLIKTEPFDPAHVNVADQRSHSDSLWHTIRKMISVRKQYPFLAGEDFTWVETGNPHLAVYLRADESQEMLVVQNLSGDPQPVSLPDLSLDRYHSLVSSHPIQNGMVEPYGYQWGYRRMN
jgi:maltose alpha-D-glucosyltransferase / alpha-amylase